MNGSMTAIITAVTVAVLTFVFQKTFSNLIKGISIFLTKPFRIGDRISLRTNMKDIVSGNIEAINLHHIAIRTYHNDIVIVNNSQLDDYIIVNSDKTDIIKYPQSISFMLDTDNPLTREHIQIIKRIIIETVVSHPDTLNTEETTNLVAHIEERKLVMQYSVMTNDINTSFHVCSDVAMELVARFADYKEIRIG